MIPVKLQCFHNSLGDISLAHRVSDGVLWTAHVCVILSEKDARYWDVQIVYWQVDSLRVCKVYTLAEEEYDKHTVDFFSGVIVCNMT